MNRSEIPFQTVAALGQLIRNGELSPVEVVDAYLERVESLNSEIRAYLTITGDQARHAAQEAEEEIAAGRYRGPLHGIPIAVKDQIYTQGIRTTGGTPVFDDFVPAYDATVITRLKEAGAALLGKLNMTEFATTGLSHQFDPPRNPWDQERSSGGSSSGSGAATAAFMCAASLGEDTGGSVRFPAAWCGLAGHRPTWGLVSRYGVMPGVRSMDTVGPLARTVEDCAILLFAIAGHDPRDRMTRQEPLPDYRASLSEDLSGLRIGVLREVLYHGSVDGETGESIIQAASTLGKLGAKVEEMSVPMAAHAGPINGGIRVEAPTTHRNLLLERAQDIAHDNRIGYMVNAIMPATHYYKAVQLRTLLRAQMMQALNDFDLPDNAHGRGAGPAVVSGPGRLRGGKTSTARRVPADHGAQPGQSARPGRALRLQLRGPATELADCGPPLRGRNGAAGRTRLPAGHRLAHPPPAGVGRQRVGDAAPSRCRIALLSSCIWRVMTQQHDDCPGDIIVVGDRIYRLTYHVLQRIEQREIERQWLVEVLDNWVARRAMPEHRSMNYFGVVPGRNSLFMVAVSEDSLAIPSAFFHSIATERYRRSEYGYFDEVREVRNESDG